MDENNLLRYRIVAEVDGEDVVLSSYAHLFDAELALTVALNHDWDAYLVDELELCNE